MATKVASSTSPFKWPADLSKVGLNAEEVRQIESVITSLRKTLPETTPSSESYVYSLSKTKRVSSSGEEFLLPRRVIVYKNRSIVVLNSKGVDPLKGGVDQPVIKWAYNPDEGIFCLKKRLLTPAQSTIVNFIRYSATQKRGFANVLHCESHRGKHNYFEEYYPLTLSEVYNDNSSFFLDLDCLLDLQDSLRSIHELTYQPASLTLPNGSQISYDKLTPLGKTLDIWWNVIGQWLKVDPDIRPNLAENYISRTEDTGSSSSTATKRKYTESS